jgi:hypothetical protein
LDSDDESIHQVLYLLKDTIDPANDNIVMQPQAIMLIVVPIADPEHHQSSHIFDNNNDCKVTETYQRFLAKCIGCNKLTLPILSNGILQFLPFIAIVHPKTPTLGVPTGHVNPQLVQEQAGHGIMEAFKRPHCHH